MWTFSIGQTSGLSQSVINMVLSVAEDAADYWGRYINFRAGEIDIVINFISLADDVLAQAGPLFFFERIGPGDADVFQAGTIRELVEGSDPNGANSDIEIDLNLDALKANEFHLGGVDDPDVPFGKFDLFTVILHEIGHGLGILSFEDDPDGDVSEYELLIDTVNGDLVFAGASAAEVFGGNVPLDGDESHIGVRFDLMNAGIGSAQRFFVSSIDVAVLKDTGLPILEPTSSDDLLYGFEKKSGPFTFLFGDDDISLLGGNDIYFGLSGDDTIKGGAGADTMNGGSGADMADYGSSPDGVLVRLWNGTGERGHARSDVLAGIENLAGSTLDDLLIGENGNSNYLAGRAGNDFLSGLFGDDTLQGGSGNDKLKGGSDADVLLGASGRDTADYEGSSEGVLVRLWSGVGERGAAEGDMLSDVENLAGSSLDDLLIGANGVLSRLAGRSGNDFLSGLSGDDTLKGGADADTLKGGAGADILEGGLGADTADYGGSSAGVLVRLWNGTGERGHAQGDVLSAIESLAGSSLNDLLIGADGSSNHLAGRGGDDYLSGLSGADTLDGGAGADILKGGSDNDRFEFGAGGGNDTILDFVAGAGTDDFIVLSGLGTDYDTFAEVLDAASDDGNDTAIDFGGSDIIVLINVRVAQLHADDFIYG